MKKYETVIIIGGNTTEEERKTVINKVKDYISKNGILEETEELGLKRLAYEVKKQNQGYYYVINFELKSKDIYELERIYRITDEILKFIVVRKES